jgi:hypothetical protein
LAGENGGKTWRERMGGRNGAGKFSGKKEKTTCAMPMVALDIGMACDVILAGGTDEKWPCAMPMVPLGIDVKPPRHR